MLGAQAARAVRHGSGRAKGRHEQATWHMAASRHGSVSGRTGELILEYLTTARRCTTSLNCSRVSSVPG
jgi:hypothetical protein